MRWHLTQQPWDRVSRLFVEWDAYDLFTLELDAFDRALIEECGRSKKLSDILLALEVIVRRTEEAQERKLKVSG